MFRIKKERPKYYFPKEKSGICVVKRNDESDEDLVKRFKRKFAKSGISKEVKERLSFEKPSDKKRRKKAQSIRAIKREEEKVRKAQLRKIKRRRKNKNDRSNKR